MEKLREGCGVKIWMTERAKKGGWYVARLVLGIAGTAAACAGGSALLAAAGLALAWPLTDALLLGCLGGTLAAVLLAVRLGNAGARDALVWLQDGEGGLFVLDARWQAGGRGALSRAAQTGKILRRIAEEGASPDSFAARTAARVLRVENLKELRNGRSAVCQVQFPDGRECRYTFRIRSEEGDDGLFEALSRLIPEGAAPDPFDNRRRIRGLCWLLVFLLCAAVCALSYPGIGVLPEALYFPFLGISALPLFLALCEFVRQHRGE